LNREYLSFLVFTKPITITLRNNYLTNSIDLYLSPSYPSCVHPKLNEYYPYKIRNYYVKNTIPKHQPGCRRNHPLLTDTDRVTIEHSHQGGPVPHNTPTSPFIPPTIARPSSTSTLSELDDTQAGAGTDLEAPAHTTVSITDPASTRGSDTEEKGVTADSPKIQPQLQRQPGMRNLFAGTHRKKEDTPSYVDAAAPIIAASLLAYTAYKLNDNNASQIDTTLALAASLAFLACGASKLLRPIYEHGPREALLDNIMETPNNPPSYQPFTRFIMQATPSALVATMPLINLASSEHNARALTIASLTFFGSLMFGLIAAADKIHTLNEKIEERPLNAKKYLLAAVPAFAQALAIAAIYSFTENPATDPHHARAKAIAISFFAINALTFVVAPLLAKSTSSRVSEKIEAPDTFYKNLSKFTVVSSLLLGFATIGQQLLLNSSIPGPVSAIAPLAVFGLCHAGAKASDGIHAHFTAKDDTPRPSFRH
jgi:hypothetical protein